MAVAGDRVVFEGNKVGGGRREGQVIAVRGTFLEIRWPDGSSSLIAPGPGTVRVVESGGRATEANRSGARKGSAGKAKARAGGKASEAEKRAGGEKASKAAAKKQPAAKKAATKKR